MIKRALPSTLEATVRPKRLTERLHIDPPLLLGLTGIALLGIAVLYSAGSADTDLLKRQGIRLGFGAVIMIVFAQIPPARYHQWSPWVYIASAIMLIAVLIAGDIGKGAQRWLNFGVVRFQPSELAKLAIPMMVAWFMAKNAIPPRWWQLVTGGALIVIPVLLIAKQPDLGTALLVSATGFFVLFLAGLSWRILIGGGIALIPATWLLWEFGMKDYQRQRVLTFLNPDTDPLGSGYHIIKSTIAVGSGGWYGKGWTNGTQSQLDFLPERSTDFIFAVFGEEFGLIGGLVLLALYGFIVGRGLLIAINAQDSFSRLLAGSLSLTLLIYVFVNIGMVIGLLPVVGVPLPLISYGGTSMVTLMAGFGILMSIHTHRRLLTK